MPTVLRIDGHRFFFFSNEGNEPPHIHVETAENTAKFWLGPVVLASSRGYPSEGLTRLHKLVVENESLFLEKWHEYFSGE